VRERFGEFDSKWMRERKNENERVKKREAQKRTQRILCRRRR